MTSRILTALVLFVALMFTATVSAQPLMHSDNHSDSYTTDTQTGVGVNSKDVSKSIFSLFDPSRFQMHQSYSIAFMSGGAGSQSIAMYLNSINYKLADPLSLQIDLAYIHQPQTLFGAEGTSGLNGKILPSFRLLWEPSKDFHMAISYERRSGYYDPYYNSYYDPFYRDYGNRSLFGR